MEFLSYNLGHQEREKSVYGALVQRGMSWWQPGRIFVNYSDEELEQFIKQAERSWQSYVSQVGRPSPPKVASQFLDYYSGNIYRTNIDTLEEHTIVQNAIITPN